MSENPFYRREEVQHAALELLGYYSLPGGYTPGGFVRQLIILWEKADVHNRVRLSIAFPEMAEAIDALGCGRETLHHLAYPEDDPEEPIAT